MVWRLKNKKLEIITDFEFLVRVLRFELKAS